MLRISFKGEVRVTPHEDGSCTIESKDRRLQCRAWRKRAEGDDEEGSYLAHIELQSIEKNDDDLVHRIAYLEGCLKELKYSDLPPANRWYPPMRFPADFSWEPWEYYRDTWV